MHAAVLEQTRESGPKANKCDFPDGVWQLQSRITKNPITVVPRF